MRNSRAMAITAMSVATLLTAGTACKRHKHVTVETEEEAPLLATVVNVADPKAAPQLLTGFYGIEQNAWRWTSGRFSALLRPPRTATSKGAELELHFTIPDVVISKLHALSLAASVNGTPLSPESYTQAGQFTYSRDVPARLLGADSAKVDFAVDKTIPPSAADQRELGVIVSSVGFAAK
jgi:hypothetical protein